MKLLFNARRNKEMTKKEEEEEKSDHDKKTPSKTRDNHVQLPSVDRHHIDPTVCHSRTVTQGRLTRRASRSCPPVRPKDY